LYSCSTSRDKESGCSAPVDPIQDLKTLASAFSGSNVDLPRAKVTGDDQCLRGYKYTDMGHSVSAKNKDTRKYRKARGFSEYDDSDAT
jgi:hypothetical protein